MRGPALLAAAAACLFAVSSPSWAAGLQRADEGTSVETEGGEVEIGVWIEVDVPDGDRSGGGSDDPAVQCHFRRGSVYDLLRWVGLNPSYFHMLDTGNQLVLKLCREDGELELATFWVYQPRPPPPPTLMDTARLRNEAWSRLAIPEPITRTAPAEVAVVQLPTFVWVPAADRTPISETATTTLEGHEVSLTATASPRRLGFLRVDMGDGNTLWCDASEVEAFNPARDPFDQQSGCFHYYRHSSVNQPFLRYQVRLTAYWDVSVSCAFNGSPCANPPPAVPTQVLTARTHPLAVAEIQALGRFG